MSIKSIKIKNLLSFDELIIDSFEDINCIVGINNVGKSNLLKLIKFFYKKLDGKRELPPMLNHNYTSFGSITITYLIKDRVKKRLKERGKNIFQTNDKLFLTLEEIDEDMEYDLTLKIHSNDSISWSEKNNEILSTIKYYYPFFDIEGRHISLYNWDKLWSLISSLKSFNTTKLEEIIFENEELNNNRIYKEFKKYVNDIQNNIETSKYNYQDKILSLIKVQLKGDKFLNENNSLETQSDGTNSHKFIETFLKLLIVLTRRDYIVPIIYVDEPEIGLHPKKNEELISNLFDIYSSYKTIVPYPTMIFSTHSPSIVKKIIKLFDSQQVLHFLKTKKGHTRVSKLNSSFEEKFVNIFSDNEARLFFSNFILFVEGETELELFSNKYLKRIFPILKKIDIYKSSSNVIGSNINPSSLNATIPFLFLFDADKIYELSTDEKSVTLHLQNKNESLYILPTPKHKEEYEKIISKYKKGYSVKYKNIVKNLETLKEFNGKKIKYNAITFNLNKKEFLKINQSLKTYLKMKNIDFLKTTIEETLINRDCKELFFLWLKNKYSVDFSDFIIKTKKFIIQRTFYKKRVGIGKIIYLNPRTNTINKTIEFKKRRKYIDDVIIEYIRVYCFQGKFENLQKSIILNSKKEKQAIANYLTIVKSLKKYNPTLKISEKQKSSIHKSLNINEKSELNKIRLSIINRIQSLNINVNDKTSGWVTSFLSFAVSHIESNVESIHVKDEFIKNFRELYAIIHSIEEKF